MSGRSDDAEKVPISVLVLTYNEAANVAACLRSISWAREVFVVDSFSTDATVEIAENMGATTCQHAFDNCAAQWNWALNNLPFSNEWVLVLDADERISQALAEEIIRAVTSPTQAFAGYYLKFRFWFMGRWLRHGGLYPTWVLRLFKRGAGYFGRHGVSEHLILEGRKGYLEHAFDHRDDKPLSDWIEKHNRYAELEAEEYLRERPGHAIVGRFWGNQAERKQWIKLRVWNRMPLLVRPFLFFLRNYFLKGGFLDGRQGFIYHVLWSFWVRFLIDVKIIERRMRQGEARLREESPARQTPPSAQRLGQRGYCLLPTAHCLPPGYRPPPTAHCLPPGYCPLPTAHCLPASADVRTLFNHEARGWRSKYVPHGKLHSRVEQFTARLAELCPAPARILDMGCGTGEIAAALSQMGYPVTACDFAEEMMAVARRNYARTPVDWVGLEPEWKALPFADASFDGIVASSVFEYLDDVPRVAAELSRVLRPEGVLLLTVPNPCNSVRKLEGRLRSMRLVQQVSSALHRVQRIGSYAAYLRLSRNRFAAQGWQSVLSAAHFAPLNQRDFAPETWRRQARAPLVLLAVKRVAVGGSGQFDAEEALCRPLLI